MPSRIASSLALALALPLAATLVVAATDASAGPKTTAPKSSPTTTPKLVNTPALVDRLAKIKPTSAATKTKLARAAGIAIDFGDLEAPIKLSVRKPFANSTTALAFVRPDAVLPRDGEGIVLMASGMMVPTGVDFFGMMQGEDLVTHAMPSNALSVQFRAAANKHYIVDCKYSDGGAFTSVVTSGTTTAAGSPDAADGHVIQFVRSSATRRDVVVQFLSNASWVGSSCEITPVG